MPSNSSKKFAIAILAAGKGTRLKSKHPKVLHRAGGKALLEHVIAAAAKIVPATDVFAIIGHQADRVRQAVAPTGVQFVEQTEQRGTGHAIMTARESLSHYDFFLVLSGDVPLIRPETIAKVRDAHLERRAAMTILTTDVTDPFGYGRILRKSGTDEVAAIIEHKSCTPEQLSIHEINSGIYAFSSENLFAHIDRLTTDNPHGEFYLTDMAQILRAAGEKVIAVSAADFSEVLGVNTRVELAQIDAHLRMEKCTELMRNGVSIFRPETCVIDAEVEIEPDTVIEPFVRILGKSRIGADCHVESYTTIENTTIGDRVLIQPNCVIEKSVVGNDAVLGPFAHLRPQSEIGDSAHVGNFVELKKTKLGPGSKANHLTYLGDATIGSGVNVGAGTITCNYDGLFKHQTVIEDGAFIGSDTTLVAPVKVGANSYIGASSCITDEVPAGALAIGRGRQVNKEGWVKKMREQKRGK